MNSYPKYRYPEAVAITRRQWPCRQITHPPIWASVDLRDGNQALPEPMNPVRKMAYFELLVKIGFKEIEVGFPSASQDDFDFVRKLIDENLIPDDVRISILTQARKHLIERSVESLIGVKQAVIHCYVATSELHGQFVFDRDQKAVKAMAIDGTKMIMKAVKAAGMTEKIGYEFSPEEFTDSNLDFVIDLCTSVKKTWGKSKKNNFILNLPATVERRPPYQYADMIEYFRRHYPYLKETTISLHAHNDQGCAVAATEMALLAGADRVEGTIFGHGERTGNLDITTLALNLYSRGINIGLDFSNMPEIVRIVEDCSGIDVHPRHPYAGQLVFTAFSGSHQDAIRKGMDRMTESANYFQQGWKVPYLHIDPADIGRSYEKLIRINSQSGKGGIAFVLEKEFRIFPPKQMLPDIGGVIQHLADAKGGEISSEEVYQMFLDNFVNVSGTFKLKEFTREDCGNKKGDQFTVGLKISINGKNHHLSGNGNGPISAVTNALQSCPAIPAFVLDDFSEKSMGHSADAVAIAFVGIKLQNSGRLVYGAGQHSNIDRAAIAALFSALNRAETTS